METRPPQLALSDFGPSPFVIFDGDSPSPFPCTPPERTPDQSPDSIKKTRNGPRHSLMERLRGNTMRQTDAVFRRKKNRPSHSNRVESRGLCGVLAYLPGSAASDWVCIRQATQPN